MLLLKVRHCTGKSGVTLKKVEEFIPLDGLILVLVHLLQVRGRKASRDSESRNPKSVKRALLRVDLFRTYSYTHFLTSRKSYTYANLPRSLMLTLSYYCTLYTNYEQILTFLTCRRPRPYDASSETFDPANLPARTRALRAHLVHTHRPTPCRLSLRTTDAHSSPTVTSGKASFSHSATCHHSSRAQA
jgi:hypothetical protein